MSVQESALGMTYRLGSSYQTMDPRGSVSLVPYSQWIRKKMREFTNLQKKKRRY